MPVERSPKAAALSIVTASRPGIPLPTRVLCIGSQGNLLDRISSETQRGIETVARNSAAHTLTDLGTGQYGAVVVDVGALDCSIEFLLDEIGRIDARIPVVVHHPTGTVDDAIHLTRHGAFTVLLGRMDPQRLGDAVERALKKWHASVPMQANDPPWRRFLIGVSRSVLEICEVIELVASKRCTVLITGETGTGKEVVARALHAAGDRAAAPMVAVNCTALPSNLAETELFGHAKGAFTGAHTSRVGRFEQAHRSTIFLDEIGDLPLELQPKLLRVLQEHELQRIGSSETIRVDARVIAASNVDLEAAVRERRFREDLYYRLNVVPVHLPPLRDRKEDIPLLLDHFLAKIQAAEGGPPKRISPEAVDYLQTLDWPGNIRQLEHVVQMAVALSGERNLLVPTDFRARQHSRPLRPEHRESIAVAIPHGGIDFDEVVGNFELSLLNQALAASGGNKARAADLLRIKRTTLLAKIKSFEERKAGVAPALVNSPTPACADIA